MNVFERAHVECDIDITFTPKDDGSQENECRDLLVSYAEHPSVPLGRKLAARLQTITTHRSKLGLLFMMYGRESGLHRLVVSRFPADQGIIAEEHKDKLSVEFIERVFMKSAKAYKSAYFESDSLEGGFWEGRAIDHQISGPRELSDYWIRDFLASELRTTAAAGTKRMAVAIRDAIKSTEDLTVREELIAATTLLRSRDGTSASGEQLVERLGLSEKASSALKDALPRPELMSEVFQFDRSEFEKHIMYRLVELDNGGSLLAEDAAFDSVFTRTPVDDASGSVRFSTEGRVIDARLRKTK